VLDVRKLKKAVNSEIAFDAIKKEIEQSNNEKKQEIMDILNNKINDITLYFKKNK
jgi:hypothetical protein